MPLTRWGPVSFDLDAALPNSNEVFLGRRTLISNAATIPAITFGVYRELRVVVFIVGYSGAGIARIRVGGAAIDTGNNYASSLLEGATLNATAVSIPGWPLGVATTTGPRWATATIYNELGRVKRVVGESNSISVAANTAPTMTQRAGIWVNTTAAIQTIDVANYDTLIATAVSTNTLTSGSSFSVWGRN